MTTTDDKQIYKALLAAQKEMGNAAKDSTNPHFRSSYASLESVIKAVYPALHKAGIVVVQAPTATDDGARVLTTTFYHESGEYVYNRVPILTTKNDAQGYGSGLTYARRYGLMCLAGIAASDDDDGNAACDPAEEKAPPADAFLKPKPPTKNDLIDQVVAMADMMGCFLEEDHFLEFVGQRAGKRVKDMTKPELKGLMKWLETHQEFATWDDAAIKQLRDAERAMGV